MRNKRGFTGIDVIVLVVIIAITAIAIPSILNMEQRAAEKRVREQFKETFGIQLPEREGNALFKGELAAIRPSVMATKEIICGPRDRARNYLQEHKRLTPPTNPALAQKHLERLNELIDQLMQSRDTCSAAEQLSRSIPGLLADETEKKQ